MYMNEWEKGKGHASFFRGFDNNYLKGALRIGKDVNPVSFLCFKIKG